MRIALLVAKFEPGGLLNVSAKLASGLETKGHKVRMISATSDPGTYVHTTNDPLALKPDSTFQSFFQLRKLIFNGDYDVVIANQFFMGLIVLAARPRRSATPLILVEHGSIEYWRDSPKFKDRLVLKLSKLLLGRADQLVAVSLETTQGMNDQFFRIRCSAKYMPNAVLKGDEPVFVGNQIDSADRQGIIFVGRLAPEKRVHDVIRAYASLADEVSDDLIILGDGPDMASCVSLVQELGMTRRVKFKGFVENVNEYLVVSKCLVLASSHEGLATVLIEALAYGCQVVTTDCPSGPKEVTKNGKYGQLVEIGDVKALSMAVKMALQGQLEYEGLAEHLRQFTVENSADNYESLCQEAIRVRRELLAK